MKFPLYDTGIKDLGYQYYKNMYLLKRFKWLPKDPSYFDIDLTDSGGNLINSRYKLIHIAHMLLGTDTAFVIKQEGGTQDDGNMICAFNYNGFLEKEEIFSGYSMYQQMTINDYSTDFYDEYDEWITKWDNSFEYLMGFTSRVKGSDFSNYLEEIFSGTSNFATEIRDILTFLSDRN